jgi:hypothetical protein
VNRLLLGELARRAPLLPGREQLAFIDIDAMQKRVYGRRKQGAAFGHTKIQGKSLLVRGLNALAATICTPLGAPVIAAVRLRGGNANSARGAVRGRGDQDGPGDRVQRAGHRAGGFVVLLCRVLRRRPPGRRPVLGHGEHGLQGHRGHRRDQPGRLDADPLSARDLG